MTRLSKWVQLIAALAVLAAPVAARQVAPAALLLEAANHKAVLEGDLRGAIKIYQDIVARFGTSDRAAAAMALLKMGEYFETLGDPEAPKAYEQVATQYADQVATAAAARARLRSGVPRLICEDCADMFGSISPDGRFLATTKAYAGGDRAGDIGLLELSSRTLAPLRIEGSGAEATGLAMAPVFSPDGRQIVYAWLSQSGNGLRIIPREPSGKMRVLQRAGAPPSVLLPLAWSPSGLILALSQESDRRMALVTVAAADGAVRSLKTLGFRVSPGPHIASASPDGRFVAYEQFVTDPPAFVNQRNGAGLDRQIHVIAADGSSDVPVTMGAGVKRWATWTPNGSHVLYVSNVAGAWDLWATPIRDGRPAGEAVLVRKNIGDVMSLGVSAAGAYHFYERRAGVLRASLIPTAGSAPGAARLADSLIGTGPVWSPDGKAIAVGRPGAVVVRTTATGEERVFARTGVAPLPFMWFPDSTALLVQVRDSANAQSWYRLELASGEFRKLVQEKSDPGFWAHQNVRTLSPDGHTLFYGTCTDQACLELNRITALDLETGTYRNVVQLPAANGGLPKTEQDFAVAASPDGLSLALMHRDPKLNATHLAVVGVNGQGYRELLPPVQATNLRNKLVWSRDGRFIYFTTRTGSPGGDLHRVMRVAVSGGAPEPAGLEADRLESFDVSPDGTRLAFSTQRTEGAGELHWSLDVSWLMKGIRQAEISPVISVGPNVQVSIDRPNQAHSEPTIAADPTDAGRLLLGVHIDHPRPTGIKSMVYASLDSGRTWRPSLEPKDATAGDDATVAFGPTGTAFFSSLSAQGGLFRSTDGGRTWEAPTRIPRGYSRDRSYLVADNTGGRFNGRLYLTGTLLPRLTFNSMGFHTGTGLYASVDDGRIFGNPILRLGAWSWNPNDGTDPDGVHVEMAYHIGNSNSVVLSDGTVLWAYGRSKPGSDNRLSWARDRTAPIRPLSVANYWLEIIGSSDGGETLIEARRIGDMWMNGSRSRTAGAHLAVDPGSAAFKDRLYAVWADFRSNRLEVFLAYSADRGTTWSPPVRINDDQPARDPLIDGPDATHPTVAVNRDGVVAVTWYDRRESQDNLSWHLRMRASLDGGDSWLPSVKVSEQPNTFGGGERWDIGGGIGPGSDNGNPLVLTTFLSYAGFFKEAGDNNGFVADAAGVFHPIWIDNRTGVRQVWTADVRVRGAAGVNGGGDLAALRDQGSRIRLGGEMAINPATGTLTIVARLRNDTRTETIRGPLKVRLLDLSSELAETIEAVNADNGMAQGGAVWDFSQLIPPSGLAPGSVSESRVMEFHLTGLRQTFRNGGVITTGMAGFRARVLGPGPAPAK